MGNEQYLDGRWHSDLNIELLELGLTAIAELRFRDAIAVISRASFSFFLINFVIPGYKEKHEPRMQSKF